MFLYGIRRKLRYRIAASPPRPMHNPPYFLAATTIEIRIIEMMDHGNLFLCIIDNSRLRFDLSIKYSFEKARTKCVPLVARQCRG